MTKKRPLVGDRVRTIRNITGLKMDEFSNVFGGGLQPYQTYNIEYGKCAKDSTIDAISKTCRISRGWLMGEDVPMASPAPSPEKVTALKEALRGVGVKPSDLKLGSDVTGLGLAILRLRSVL